MKKNYYGVAGVNGYGVYNNYNKVIEAKPYLEKFKVKGHKTFDKAKEWAEDTYYELQENMQDYCIEEITKINWIYYVKHR